MGLMQRWPRWASARPHVYLVEAPGGAYVRRAVESALDARGWHRSEAPGQADVLLAAGDADAISVISGHLDLVWSQLPGPRVRRHVADASAIGPALDEISRALRDTQRHADDARSREDEVARWLEDDDEGRNGGSEGHDHGGHDDGGHQHGGHDHNEHGGGMAPSGIPLAGGADDRDGLEMDQLVHTLGPVLPLWPGGLVVRLTLAGDMLADVQHRWLGGDHEPAPQEAATAHWDAVAAAFALAGDERTARWARGVRDADDSATTDSAAATLRRRVAGLSRLRALPSDAAAALLADPAQPWDRVDIPALLRGRDLADARLLLAAFAPRLRRDSSFDDQDGGHDDHTARHAGHAVHHAGHHEGGHHHG